jgi:hypothetical protein
MAANGEFAFKTPPKAEPEQYPQVALMVFCAADLPFSCIGDVVTWPYTAAYSFINQPVPTPAMMPPTAEPRPQTYFMPENKEPETKSSDTDADKGKPKDDSPSPLPPPRPLPSKPTP